MLVSKRYMIRDGELYHADHKYVSRKWKNGRWVYTYDIKGAVNNVRGKIRNALGFTARDNMINARRDSHVAKRDLGYSKAYQQHVDRTLAPYMEGRNRRSPNMSSTDAKFQKSFEKRFSWDKLNAEQEVQDGKKKVVAATRAAEEAIKKYENTPVGKIETAAKKVKKFVINLLSKISGRKIEDKKAARESRVIDTTVTNSSASEAQARNEKRMAEVRARNKLEEEKRKKYITRTRNYDGGPNPTSRSRQYKK